MHLDRTLSRRSFLEHGAAFAGAAIVGRPVLAAPSPGDGGRAAPSERITVGMIGMGRQAYLVNMKQLLRMPDVQVVAVCDVDSWRLENARSAVDKHYRGAGAAGGAVGCKAYVDYQELLARDDIDAVMISTPDHWHAPMALAAMKAGKDVSLEKPITRTIAEGRALSDAARKLGRVFRVDSELRSIPSVHRAAELARNGRIGEIRTVIVGVPGSDKACPPQPAMPVPAGLDYERWQGPAPLAPYTLKRVHPVKSYGRPGWMRHLFYCDGMITNWGTHLCDGAMWCTGLDRTGPVEVEGTGTYPPPDSFWNVLLEFEVKYRFASGATWTYRTEKPYFRLVGEEGWIEASFNSIAAHPASLLDAKKSAGEVSFARKDEKRDFIDCVKSREQTLEPAEVGHRVTSLCHLGHIAIQVGKKLRWDPEKEIFPGNDTANRFIREPIHSPVE